MAVEAVIFGRVLVGVAVISVVPDVIAASPLTTGLPGAGTWAKPALLASVIVAAGCAAWLLTTSRAKAPPKIARLFIHPIKSCAPIELSKLWFDELGVVNDRRWALVDTSKCINSRVLTNRTHPRMALILPILRHPDSKPADNGTECIGLGLSAPGMPDLPEVMPSDSNTIEVSLWNVHGVALDCGDAAADWLNKFLGETSLRLAYLSCRAEGRSAMKTREMCEQVAWNGGNRADSVYPEGTRVGFADGSHLTLLSDASLVNLNRRMAKNAQDVCAERFRMNVILSGTRAYAEEAWKSFSIGTVDFVVARLCNRCTGTLVDPSTGETGREPLRLLRSYRSKEHLWQVDERHGTAPILGTKVCNPSCKGSISVGDEVDNVVLRRSSDRRY
eukprot:TRINITY_DN90780_c0_g1_i1.p1 TRINITY_DN90780_c0_g1~~TRINITY_DN90780_c0_g1_i1.p1  ORF type:complete len:399 (+),score=41.52 TRINITY_DN90780_c0_g1_i1:31-1197(+)